IASVAVARLSAALVPQLRNGVAAASVTRCSLAARAGVGQQESQDDYPASVRSLATFLAANDMPGHVDDVTTEGMRALMSSGRNKVPAESPGCHLRALLAKAPKWVSSSPQAAASG
ncbi:MAG TPA: hypothetical protein VME44_13115, partial [Streptosporangiaceae bacterium]|nr:hypothetical protein [Streptosporangiaceae bacterium]